MATSNTYGVYFDRYELDIDRHGHLTNPDALQIVEVESDEDGRILACRRVNQDGRILAEHWEPEDGDLVHPCEDDCDTIAEAIRYAERWIDDHTEWIEDVPQTYWHPAEYICIGIAECEW